MHAGPIEKDKRFKMAAVCDIDAERLKQASNRFGCPLYTDYHEMLREEHPDLVCIVTMSHQHARMACDCLKAGSNVLVTKPWALDESEALAMIEAQKASGKLLLPWLPSRWGSVLRRLQALVASGSVGRVFLVRRTVGSFGTRCDWQTQRKYGGGYLLNWGAHIVDPPLVLAGSPPQSVFGIMRQVINPGDVEDIFLAMITLADGTAVQAEFTVTTLDLPDWVVQGDTGTIVVWGNELSLQSCVPEKPSDSLSYGRTKDRPELLTETVPGEIYGDEHEIYDCIAKALMGEAEYPVSTGDALELTRVLDAIRLSDSENRVVRLSVGEGS